MKITVAAVGKLKETFFSDAAVEYSRRLSRYCKLLIIQVADEKVPEKASAAQLCQIKEREGRRILAKVKDSSYVVALAIEGKKMSSEALAARLRQLALEGRSDLVFAIGGSVGLSEAVKHRADELLSFSDMTFPHQLSRIMLLEQLYRCFKINAGEPYHK